MTKANESVIGAEEIEALKRELMTGLLHEVEDTILSILLIILAYAEFDYEETEECKSYHKGVCVR